jgi:hypothetical protein
MAWVPRVGRLVAVRGVLINGTLRLRPGVVTAVGGGTSCTIKVQTHGSAPESYVLSQWSRAAPATPGWVRT